MNEDNEYVKKLYNCPVCKETHTVDLPKNLADNRTKYPFTYVFLHGELKDLLTTLYIDKNLQIRGERVIKLKDDDIFSKDQVLKITQQLMNEIVNLQNENTHLRYELDKLKKSTITEIH